MNTIADNLRAEAAELRKKAASSEALASQLDGQSDAQRAFLGDPRALVAAAIRQDPDVRFLEDADTAKAA